MNKNTRRLLPVIGLLLALVSSALPAAAQTSQNTLPTTRTPTSARFDLTGSISSSTNGTGSTVQITGSGAMSGSDSQVDLTISSPQGAGTSGPTSLTMSFITIADKLYFKFTGIGSETDNQWYVTDAGTSGIPSGGAIPGMPSSAPPNPALSDAYKITQVGEESLNGVQTTKYQIDVDLAKLEAEAAAQNGGTPAPTAQFSQDSKMTMWLWIGDADQYLHQFKLTLNTTVSGQDLPASSLSMDFTLTFHDFDTAVKITAPPDAKPLDLGAEGGTGSLLTGAGVPLGGVLGMPAGMMSGMPAGMPTTGSDSQGSLLPWAALGALCLAGGIVLRRRGARAH